MKLAPKIAFWCVLALTGSAFADQVAINQFKGIDNNQSSVIIGPDMAQDTLNVEVSPGGHSIKKRAGYGTYKTLFTAANQSVHGGFHFFDATGNDVQIWASSTSVYGIVADATPTQIVSSATLNSTLDCADTQGSAYCVDSSRDFYIRTNGASLTSWATSPLGTMVESTPDRVVVAGVAGNLSTLYVSQSNTFNNYVTGPLTTDAFTEPIAAPGSKLTHIRWACGKLLWWKDQSFGWFAFEDQYTAQIKIISDNIGTFDNTSTIDPGGSVWFRGQDGHIWQYDCSGLIKQSIEITPLVQASGRRTANSFTQSSQVDWQTGLSSGTTTLSTTISVGDIVTSSLNVTENSSTQWNQGTKNNVTVNISSISLTIANGSFPNGSFESTLSPWKTTHTGSATDFFPSNNYFSGGCSSVSGFDGSYWAETTGSIGTTYTLYVVLKDTATNLDIVTSTEVYSSQNCVFATKTLVVGASNIGKRAQLSFTASGTLGTSVIKTTASFIIGGDISYRTAQAIFFTNYFVLIDFVSTGYGGNTSSGTFTSQSYNSGMPYSFNMASATWSVNTTTPSFVLQKSADNVTFYDVTGSTGINTASNASRYYRYLATFTVTDGDISRSALTGVQLIAASSGTYFSAVKNAPNISAWSTFNPTYSNGDGAHNFFVRASGQSFNVLSSTPNWTVQSPNALVASTSTGVYFQIIDSFTITSATGTTPTLNDFTVNWYDGNATDQAYMLYFDNAIWTSVAYGVGVSTNNYILRRDLINDGWNIYGFGAGGMLVQNAHLFFGGVPATAQVFQFGSGHSDNGTAINAYWKSRDFTGADPFLQTSLVQIDTFAKKDQGSTLTTTYTLDTSTTTTSYSIMLSSTTQSIIQHRKQLPLGKNGYTFSIQYGDNSISSGWEILGYRIGFNSNPWRPSN